MTEEANTETVEENEPEFQLDQEQDGPDNEPSEQLALEEEARKGGWKPEDEWNGDGEWRDAAEFIERGKDINAVMKRNNESLLKELKKSKAETKKIMAATTEIVKMHKTSTEQAVKQAIKKLEEERREAILEGDLDAVADIEREQQEHRESVVPDEQAPIEPPESFKVWVEDNQWYQTNKKMAAKADIIGAKLFDTGKFDADDPELYEAVREEIEMAYPKYFAPKENPKRGQANTVANSKRNAKPSKKTFNSLSKEEQNAYYSMKEAGVDLNKEMWAAKFDEE